MEKVVIVGGGVGGLTTALALQKAGVEVEVHEKFAHAPSRATGFTLSSYAIRELMELGLDDPARIGSPIEVTEIHNQKGDLIEAMPVGEVSRSLGAPSCDVRRPDLQSVLGELLGRGRAVRLPGGSQGARRGRGEEGTPHGQAVADAQPDGLLAARRAVRAHGRGSVTQGRRGDGQGESRGRRGR
jgi:2-polyprenyl-6-methoxyphenol hydroxylase-like FAD-dependent oxidoreductase